MKKIFYTLAVAILLVGCFGGGNKQGSKVKDSIPIGADGHNAQNSLDYEGTYIGVTPCADCEGIEVTLTLTKSDYKLSSIYLGDKWKDQKPTVSNGTYKWIDGNTIFLNDVVENTTHFRIGENKVTMLDLDGNPITGPNAAYYILTKSN